MTRAQTRGRLELPILPTAATAVPETETAAAASGGPRVGVLTLGCDKNTVDTERLLARLARAGATLAPTPEEADVVIVNTCGFIDAAREESVDTILEAVRLKGAGRVRAVVAMGCLVQRYKDELAREIPEVDLFLGLTEVERLVPELRARGLVQREDVAPMERTLRVLSTRSHHSSYLKVSEGCDHTCAFCAIPLMRGKHRSTPIEQLVQEAIELERQGVVELNLVSQDTTWYGRDIARGVAVDGGAGFVGRTFAGMAGVTEPEPVRRSAAPAVASRHGLLPELLRALLDATTIPWLRLFYMYPSGIRPELVDLIAAEPRLVPYLDMPIQHGSDAVLTRMRRPERRATILERVGWLRSAVPDLVLRTTVIVGFPGETDDDFDALLDLLEEVRFDRLGAFPYSVEEGTAAAEMDGTVPEGLKRERLERLLDLQRAIAAERLEAWVGRETDVLVDRRTGRDSDMADASARGAVGRTAWQAPEVDGVVHIADAGDAQPGTFVRVRITGTVDEDLTGERWA